MKIAVLTSGGDAWNERSNSQFSTGLAEGHEMFGIMDGYRGLLEDRFIPMSAKDVSGMLSIGWYKIRYSKSF